MDCLHFFTVCVSFGPLWDKQTVFENLQYLIGCYGNSLFYDSDKIKDEIKICLLILYNSTYPAT